MQFMRNTSNLLRRMATAAASAGLLFGLLLAPSHLTAQVGTADVLGTVTDQTGAVIPGAKITLTNSGTGIVSKTISDAKGEYLITPLQNGTYSLQVEAQGFKSFNKNNFAVSTGERVRVDAGMQPGAVTERIEVTTETAVLQTDSSSVTSSIEPKAMQDMPTKDRNFYSLAEMLPGINVGGQAGANSSGGSATTGNSEFDRRPASTVMANGQNDALNNNMVNGFDNNEVAYGNTGVRPTTDGIEEMKVVTTDAPAEFGRAAGAVINVVTKSGTNAFKGSLFEFLRNQKTDAQNFFNVGPKAPYHQNNFGGSLGGPIIKNKTFFFFGIEKDIVNKGLTLTNNVPTEYEWQQLHKNGLFDYTDHCVDANGAQIANTLGVGCASSATGSWPAPFGMAQEFNSSPNATDGNQGLHFIDEMFYLYAEPNIAPNDINHSSFSYSPALTDRVLDWELRIDHHFTPNDTVFFRFAYNPASSVFPSEEPVVTNGPWGNTPVYPVANPNSQVGTSTQNSDNIQADYAHTVRSNLVLDLKYGQSRYASTAAGPNFGKGLGLVMGMPDALPAGAIGDDLPLIGGPTFPFGPVGGPNEQPFHNVEDAYMYGVSASYVRGAHEIKVGSGMVRRHAFVDQTHNAAGFMFAPSILGALGGQTVFFNRESPVYNNNYRNREWNIYAQDNWRLTSKLTLNLGVRYDIFSPYSDLNGYMSNFDASTLTDGKPQDAHNFILGGKAGVQTYYGAVAPRLGFAYSLGQDTVIRGGFGMTYMPNASAVSPGQSMISGGGQNPPFFFNYTAMGGSLSTPGNNIAASPWANTVSPTPLTGWGLNSAVTNLTAQPLAEPDPRYYQATLGVQRQMGANAVTFQYVSVMGRSLTNGIDLNHPDMPGAGATSAAPYIYTNPNGVRPGQGALANPNGILNYVIGIGSTTYNGFSNYNALQAVFERRFSKGLNVSANYTLAHALATGGGSGGTSAPNNNTLLYGNTSNDIRNRIALTASYELPFGKSLHGVAGEIVKGWQLNTVTQWQTGAAFGLGGGGDCVNTSYSGGNPGDPSTWTGGTLVDPRCPSNVVSGAPGPPGTPGVMVESGTGYTLQAGSTNYFADRVPGKKFFKHGPNVFTSNASTELDYTALAPPTPGTDGNIGINPFYGPHFRDADVSLMKTFQVTEKIGLQFRAEVFNISNTPNFTQGLNPTIQGWNGTYATGFSASPAANLGVINDTALFATPREMQFALKLQF